MNHPLQGHGTAAANPRSMSKRWMLTVFDDNWEPNFPPDTAFGTWQRERCPETGRLHVHVYVRFVGRKRMSAVKNTFARQDMHCEIAMGSEKEATAYCEKEETRVQAGTRFGTYEENEGAQGHRSDLDAIAASCRAGESLVAIAEAHPGDYIRYHAGINALHSKVAPKPPAQRAVEVTVMWGPTATGKTHRVMTAWPDCYPVVPGRDPWGNYNGEEVVFFDEFDYQLWTIQAMNRYLDKWRVILDARYNNRYAAWTHVVICANSCPLTWYPNADLLLVQSFRRRISGRVFNVTRQDQDLATIEPEIY